MKQVKSFSSAKKTNIWLKENQDKEKIATNGVLCHFNNKVWIIYVFLKSFFNSIDLNRMQVLYENI